MLTQIRYVRIKLYIVLNPAHVPCYGMSTPTNKLATDFGDDKPTSRCQKMLNVSYFFHKACYPLSSFYLVD